MGLEPNVSVNSKSAQQPPGNLPFLEHFGQIPRYVAGRGEWALLESTDTSGPIIENNLFVPTRQFVSVNLFKSIA